MRDYARDTLDMPRLLAIVSPSNVTSTRLLERLGFSFESMTRLGAEAPEVKLYGCTFAGRRSSSSPR